MVSGMRRKTSFTLDEQTIAVAQAGARNEGKPVSQWVERAILNEASRSDVDLLEAWERSLPSEDRAVLAAFAAADGAITLDS
jgi:hypothetical protein